MNRLSADFQEAIAPDAARYDYTFETQFLIFNVFEEAVVEFNLVAPGSPTSHRSLAQTLGWRSFAWIGTKSRGASP